MTRLTSSFSFLFWLVDKWVSWGDKMLESRCYAGPAFQGSGFWPLSGLRAIEMEMSSETMLSLAHALNVILPLPMISLYSGQL